MAPYGVGVLPGTADAEVRPTDGDLRSARERFAAQILGLVLPVAYGVTRQDPSGLTFGHVNQPGTVHRLPGVVLASVCGYVATTVVHRMSRAPLAEAVARPTPAEAATHMPHAADSSSAPPRCAWCGGPACCAAPGSC